MTCAACAKTGSTSIFLNGHLLVRGVAYVTSKREIVRGAIAARTLRLEGDKTLPPEDHVVRFIGEFPCDKDGNRISDIGGSPETVKIADGLIATTLLSSKPTGGYKDYYEMMTRYIEIIENEAKALNKDVTSRQYLPWEPEPEESVFRHIDTSTSRAGLTGVNAKLEGERVGIVGIGGAGSYVLDLVSKTGVKEIHLFDGDYIETHNAISCTRCDRPRGATNSPQQGCLLARSLRYPPPFDRCTRCLRHRGECLRAC
jgi:hypothetical protein